MLSTFPQKNPSYQQFFPQSGKELINKNKTQNLNFFLQSFTLFRNDYYYYY